MVRHAVRLVQNERLHAALAFDLDVVPRCQVKGRGIDERVVEGGADLDAARETCAFHPAGGVDRVSKQTVARSLLTHCGNNRDRGKEGKRPCEN